MSSLLELQIFPEGSEITVTASFEDENDLPYIPQSITVQVNDDGTGQEMMAQTAVTPAATVTVRIPSTSNSIIRDRSDYEYRTVTLITDAGDTDSVIQQKQYALENLRHIA